MAQYASRFPSGDHASDSSHGYGDPADSRQLSSVGDVFPDSASHTSTRDFPSEATTVSSGAAIIASRLPSAVTANSRTYFFSAITFSARQVSRSSRYTSDTFRVPWPYSALYLFLRAVK